MGKLSFVLIFVLALSSCVKKDKKKSKILSGGATVETPSADAYLDTFIEYRAIAGGPADVGLSYVEFVTTLGNTTLGTCTMGTGYIKINENLWRAISKESREELIFHELGHCALNRLHENSTLPNTRPASLMNSYHMGSSVYIPAYAYYISELFSVPAATFTGLSFDAARYSDDLSSQMNHALESEDAGFECHHDGNDEFTVVLPSP